MIQYFTGHLLLRTLKEDESDALYRTANQEHIISVLPDWEITLAYAMRLVRGYALFNETAESPIDFPLVLGIFLSRKFIGLVSAGPQPELGYSPDIGFFIDQSELNHGYAREAVLGIAALCRKLWGIALFYAAVSPDNLPSRKVLSACGFEQCGTVYFRRTGEYEKKEHIKYKLELETEKNGKWE